MESSNLNLLQQLEQDEKMDQTAQSCSGQTNTMPSESPIQIVSN